MEADMKILTFLFWRLFILKATASILGGLYLCIKGNKISTITIQKMFSGYCGVIFGSLIMFLLTQNAVFMILGCVIGYFIFFLTDKIFKNNGMFLVSFVCVMEWAYIITTSIIFHNAERLKNSIDIISDKDRSYVEKYFMGDNYVIWDRCFFHGSFDWPNGCCCHGTCCKKQENIKFYDVINRCSSAFWKHFLCFKLL